MVNACFAMRKAGQCVIVIKVMLTTVSTSGLFLSICRVAFPFKTRFSKSIFRQIWICFTSHLFGSAKEHGSNELKAAAMPVLEKLYAGICQM